MKEINYLRKNKDRFSELEKAATQDFYTDARTLARKFLQITDDLSYSRTFFPKSKTTEYLNFLASRFFYDIVKSRKVSGNSLGKFYAKTFPLAVYQIRKYILMAFIIFSFFAMIGVLAQVNDNDFAELILGRGYMDMTKENIKNGDPMGVYTKAPPLQMFFQIALNNVWVMVKGYTGGIFFGYGTVLSLLHNGIMVGTFQYFCAEQGAFFTSLSTIWIHGTLEIWCCILSAGCGLALGWAIIFPGRLSRWTSLKKNGLQTGRVILGIIPLIIFAAFIESFITRHYQVNVIFNWIIILSSSAFIYWYFFIFPKKAFLENESIKKFKYNIITEEEVFI